MRTTLRVSTSAPGPARAATHYERATLTLKDSDEPPLRCQFNPTEYALSTSATWRRWQAPGAPSTAIAQFVSSNASTLSLDLFFDSRDEDSAPVADSVTRLLSWTRPTQRSIDENRPSPPLVTFVWGATATFEAYVSSANARFVLFLRDGTPLRAHVSLQLEEVPAQLPGTNPTSGARQLVRQRRLVAGESLAWVAWQEYGRADAWRAIAEASDIDDPRRLTPGMTLVIPEEETGGTA